MASSHFNVQAPEESRDITIRLLIGPNSGYNTDNGVTFFLYSYLSSQWTAYEAISEGGYWYSYTINTNDIAVVLYFNERYSTISGDTCLQYVNGDELMSADCNTVVSNTTITVAQAIEIAQALEEGTQAEQQYAIIGYVSALAGQEDDFERYNNQTYWITDERGSTAASISEGAFSVFRGTASEKVQVGDKVSAYGVIRNYYGYLEMVRPIVTILEKNPIEEPAEVVQLPYSESFLGDMGLFTIQDIEKDTLSYVWQTTTAYGMKASGYRSGPHNTESWLVSPKISLPAAGNINMTFETCLNYASDDYNSCAVKILVDNTWSDLQFNKWPAGHSWVFDTVTTSLDAYAGNEIQIAFVYRSSTLYSNATWEVRNLVIQQEGAQNPTPETPELPTIANPGEGYTTIAIYAEVCPRGAYLVGHINGWDASNDTYSFEPIADAPNWYALTVRYDEVFQGKVLARPSDEEVPLSWNYQWGRNYDPDYGSECSDMPEEGNDNVVLLSYSGYLSYENCGQPILSWIEDNGVVYVWIKNWAASPVIEAVPLETCWANTNWEGDSWYWKQMTAEEDGVFRLYTRWWGYGLNINTEDSYIGAAWYSNPDLIDNPQCGDSVLVTFVSRKGTIGDLSIQLIEQHPEIVLRDITVSASVPTDWNECYIWASYEIYNQHYNVFDSWPGQELPIVNGTVSYTFEQVATPLSIYFSNNEGLQNGSISNITATGSTCYEVLSISETEIQVREVECQNDNPSSVNKIIDSSQHTTSKILHNGQIFIRRGEKVYTLQGQELR